MADRKPTCSDCPKHHTLHVRFPRTERRRHRMYARELLLTKGGRRAYLWIGGDENQVLIASGRRTLEKLALAILKELKPMKRRGRK